MTTATKATGRISQIIGPVLDAVFPPCELPQIYNALHITMKNGDKIVAEVAQHLGENSVRAVSMQSTEGLTRGVEIVDTGEPITTPVGKEVLGRVLNVIGEPVDLAGAKALANQDRYQFQWWALGLVGARPLGEKKKSADMGIDGVIHFIDDASGKPSRVMVQVKSGHIGVNAVRELKAVAANEAIGVLITLESPTGLMKVEAVDAGYYHSPIWDKDYPKIQILTIEELLHGRAVEMPPQTQTSVTFAKAPKISPKEGEQLSLEQ